MNKQKKALFLTAANPMGIGGGCFASHAYLRAFSDIYNGGVDVVMADSWREKWDDNVHIENEFVAKPLTNTQYGLSILTGEIQRFSGVAERVLAGNPDEYDCVVANGSSISGRLWKLTKKFGIKLITIHHNYEPEYFADNTKGLHRTLYLPVVRRMERQAYRNSDYNLFLTNQDKMKFQSEYGFNGKLNDVIGVFEFADYKKPENVGVNNEQLTFVITGSLNTMQGVDGIRYFFDSLYQYLPNDCQVIISGRNPSAEIKRLCGLHSNVTLVPNPTNMSEVIASGNIYICPTRVGGGIKLRVMDGLKLGLPVITHACSARGYDMFYDTPYLKSYTNQSEFKKAVEEMAGQIGGISKADVIDKYRERFSYDCGLERMKKMLNIVD